MDTDDDLRSLLNRVAAGDLDPAEAARLLDEDPTLPTLDRGGVVPGVTISAHGVKLHLVADPSVATAVAEGPHQVREDATGLVFDLPGRKIGSNGEEPAWRWGRLRLDLPYGSGERVTIRINPTLAVGLDMTASDVHVRGLRAPLRFGCFSGALQIADHHGSLVGTITTGSAKIEAELAGPADSLTCDMGSLKLTLLPGTDTTVSATADMSTVKFIESQGTKGAPGVAGTHNAATTAVVGAGTGRLSLAVHMGSAKVTLP